MVAVATAEQADHSRGFAVIAAPETDELEFLGDRLGKTEGGLDGFCTARKKLNVRNAFRQQVTDEFEKTGTGLSREAAEGRRARVAR